MIAAPAIRVRRLAGREYQREFMDLPWEIYRNDPLWVPPLLREIREILSDRNPLFRAGPHALFLACRDGRPAGRICAGVNHEYNRVKGSNSGYVCLFESVEDSAVSSALFDSACGYLSCLGVDLVRGPISPTNGDEYRGLLVKGLDRPPMIFQAYNPPYYRRLFEEYGFNRELDYLAYRYDPAALRDRTRAVEYAMKRYGYGTEPVNTDRLGRDLADMRRVAELSMPEDWPDLLLPDMDEVASMASKLRWLAAPELIQIARAGNRAIGFSVAIPDFNQVLIRMNGRLFPTGWLTFLLGKGKIDAVRLFIMFVVPDFHGKGVAQALYHATMREGLRLGYQWAEASTVLDTNLAMRRQNEGAGGDQYKSYRVYRKKLRVSG